MDNQHKKIKGYRDLSQAEIDTMNAIKEKAEEVGYLIKALAEMRSQTGISDLGDSGKQESARCLALAKTNLQQGFMWFVRAVALPQSF